MASKKPVYTIDKNRHRTNYESMSAAAKGIGVDLIVIQCSLMSSHKVKDLSIYLRGETNGK